MINMVLLLITFLIYADPNDVNPDGQFIPYSEPLRNFENTIDERVPYGSISHEAIKNRSSVQLFDDTNPTRNQENLPVDKKVKGSK